MKMENNSEMVVDKKETVLEKLNKRNKDRQNYLETKLEQRSREHTEIEDADYFTHVFSERAKEIERNTNNVQQCDSKIDLTIIFMGINADIQELQRYLSNSTLFLPDYNIKACQNILNELTLRAEEIKQKLMPKKKFGFNSKKSDLKICSGNKNVKVVAGNGGVADGGGGGTGDGIDGENKVDFSEKAKLSSTSFKWTISKRNNEHIILVGSEVNRKDLTMSELNNCFVEIRGHAASLQISKANNCTFLCCPISRSLFADHCNNCTITAACQQFRLHTSNNCKLFLRVTSTPIIEDCNNISVGPYKYEYCGIDIDFKKSGLDENTNNYVDVADFNWLSPDKPSPNWKLMTEEELQEICAWSDIREKFKSSGNKNVKVVAGNGGVADGGGGGTGNGIDGENKVDFSEKAKLSSTSFKWTISKRNNEHIILVGSEVNRKDLTMSELNNCFVEIRGHAGSLQISKANNCTFLCCPISRSLFADYCNNCTITAACQQFRLHISNNCKLFLHVTSRAIIEDCNNIIVGPYNYEYCGIDIDFKKSGLDKNTNNYVDVADFNWLSPDKPSPNWKLMTEEELQEICDWSDIREKFKSSGNKNVKVVAGNGGVADGGGGGTGNGIDGENKVDFSEKAKLSSTSFKWTISKRNNEHIILVGSEVDRKDLTMSELNDCFVEIRGHAGSLQISKANNCTFLCCPISRSLFADHCNDCTITAACQQFRLHTSNNCKLFLHVTSTPIIEDCNNISVGPYKYEYCGIDIDFKKSGLDENTNNYVDVADFNWLSPDKPSPNWKLMTGEELQEICDWSDIREKFKSSGNKNLKVVAGNGGVADGGEGGTTISQRNGEHIILVGSEVDRKDLTMTDLNNCFVEIRGHAGSLQISRANKCTFLCCPISRSLFADHLNDCTITAACQQFRLFLSNKCKLFLHVTTRAIIEDSNDIGVGPYKYEYCGIDIDFKKSGLDENTNNYVDVADFNWLSSDKPSPNWKLMTDEELQEICDWSDIREKFKTGTIS